MTSNYYAKKGITTAMVCQFCKELGLTPSRLQHFQVAAKMLEIAKSTTYSTEAAPMVSRFGFILKPICKN